MSGKRYNELLRAAILLVRRKKRAKPAGKAAKRDNIPSVRNGSLVEHQSIEQEIASANASISRAVKAEIKGISRPLPGCFEMGKRR